METLEPGFLDFGFKSVQEVEVDGRKGLLCKGMGSKYMERDQAGEFQVTGSLADSVDTWGMKAKPPIWFHHGLNGDLGPREIGWATHWRLDDEGLYAESFVPADICDEWSGPGAKAAKAAFRKVYAGIKSGAIKGYSVGGMFQRVGNALTKWFVTELSITPTPCLASATFDLGGKALLAIGAKAMEEMTAGAKSYVVEIDDLAVTDDLPEQTVLGYVSRDTWNTMLSAAQTVGDRYLHDALLSRPAEFQGEHDADECAVCAERRNWSGVKRDAEVTTTEAEATTEAGAKTEESPASIDPALLAQATEVLSMFGAKAGAKHSAETLSAIREVVGILNDTFSLTADAA